MSRYYFRRIGTDDFEIQRWEAEKMPPREGFEILEDLPADIKDKFVQMGKQPTDPNILGQLDDLETRLAQIEKQLSVVSGGEIT